MEGYDRSKIWRGALYLVAAKSRNIQFKFDNWTKWGVLYYRKKESAQEDEIEAKDFMIEGY